ncbi:uncharacterized protein K460DRAFT_168667 [Cucurbitaria berberidis CBS 394.84]|uniref:Uncharacterized protein n=1 Tax=Cucurbitaria berberidis CBS 394.84 TaxID=1168544 RepID=A0A9P4GA53_9PLEO|nr:uncharacterized protein K460DRAFT_168667 [Cucurbitaria berberidis CBS 394.84]KAF1841509.1 hypothetical protein K460DRAFT_168667 [Cucurbitaria berberidis CBS 394.84]
MLRHVRDCSRAWRCRAFSSSSQGSSAGATTGASACCSSLVGWHVCLLVQHEQPPTLPPLGRGRCASHDSTSVFGRGWRGTWRERLWSTLRTFCIWFARRVRSPSQWTSYRWTARVNRANRAQLRSNFASHTSDSTNDFPRASTHLGCRSLSGSASY